MKTEKATFALGCFWKPDKVFSKTPGVVETTVGYIGGKVERPFYENVYSGNTGHVESIQIEFNPKKISYEKLLNIFWRIHNPTTKNRQGLDVGTQYNSVIFYHNNKQKEEAKNSKNEIQKNYKEKIITEIKKAPKFWKAERYHQKYFEKKKEKPLLERFFGFR
ncbi:MAG: peptide-methionine (S)-S-oxide reductase MsrA [Candidatus Pacearchaeota archaeon]